MSRRAADKGAISGHLLHPWLPLSVVDHLFINLLIIMVAYVHIGKLQKPGGKSQRPMKAKSVITPTQPRPPFV
jgi:hypothetical protein